MTNKQIFRKAIEKAIKNGWKMFEHLDDELLENWEVSIDKAHKDEPLRLNVYTNCGECPKGWDLSFWDYPARYVLLDLSFAKAFWGDEKIEIYPFAHDGDYKYWEEYPAWSYHLGQMVLKKDLIQYLSKYI